MGRKIFTIVVFAVMMFVVGVTAASADLVSLPSAEYITNAFSGFLPIVMSSGSAETASPVGVLHVFSTKAKTTGDAGGRVGMGEKCAAEDPNAHFCEIGAIYNALTTTGVVFNISLEQETWVDAVGFETDVDWEGLSCGGFNSEDGEGYVLEPKATNVASQFCSSNLPIACCKWVP
jgi:hypothetical protein